jgi:hypothetical protein
MQLDLQPFAGNSPQTVQICVCGPIVYNIDIRTFFSDYEILLISVSRLFEYLVN